MADLRITYTEEMVGSGHPTKADTLNRLTVVEHDNSGHHYLFPQRAHFRWKDGNEIYVGSGCYAHAGGTTAQMLKWDQELTIPLSSAIASQWYYLYMDDSNIANTLGVNILTATQFVFATTNPTYNATYKGWYNGTDMCIFSVRTNAAASLMEFWDSGHGLILVASMIPSNVISTDVDTTWVDAIMPAPDFGDDTTVYAHVRMSYVDNATNSYYRKKGSPTTLGHLLGYAAAANTVHDVRVNLVLNASLRAQVKNSAANGNTVSIWTSGFYLPGSM